MRGDAKKQKFDAVVVQKFDRFARNRIDSLAIKLLLRHDHGIKMFSVSEPFEDVMEQLVRLLKALWNQLLNGIVAISPMKRPKANENVPFKASITINHR
jgi:DNA invertase Pin-like site-specific DNA recombinase